MLESNLAISFKTENTLNILSSDYTLQYLSQRNENSSSQKLAHKCSYQLYLLRVRKLGKTQMSSSMWLFKKTVACSYHGMLLVNKGRNYYVHKLDGSQQSYADWKELVSKGYIYDSIYIMFRGFPDGSVVKNLPVNAEDSGLTPGSGRSPGGGNVNPLQYPCLKNPMARGAWRATVHGVTKDWATEHPHR